MFSFRNTRLARAVGQTMDVFGAAVSAAAAVQAGRRPAYRELEALGIDPDTFPGMDRGRK